MPSKKPVARKPLKRLVARKPAIKADEPKPAPSAALDPVAIDILRRLREALTPAALSIQNLTRRHAGHKEARAHGGGHYSLYVVSDAFTGLKPLQRQQWIHSLLGDLLESKKVHALELKLKDPDEVSSL